MKAKQDERLRLVEGLVALKRQGRVTTSQIAAELGVSARTVERWLAGTHLPASEAHLRGLRRLVGEVARPAELSELARRGEASRSSRTLHISPRAKCPKLSG